MDIYHLIITKFNIRHPEWEQDYRGQPVLDETWMDHRIALFEQYCLPSFQAQTDQNFNWLILLDATTLPHHRQKMQSLVGDFDHFELKYCTAAEIVPYIESHLATQPREAYITTHIDNDDAIHQRYVELVQSLCAGHTTALIDLELGYQAIPQIPRYRRLLDPLNPFISLLAHKAQPAHILQHPHNRWQHPNTIRYDQDPMWLQFIHGHNKLNQEIKYLPLARNIRPADFGLDPAQLPPCRPAQHAISTAIRPLHYGIEQIKRTLGPKK